MLDRKEVPNPNPNPKPNPNSNPNPNPNPSYKHICAVLVILINQKYQD
jgi:hypothetical protein